MLTLVGYVSVYLSVCWTGLRYLTDYSLLGGGIPIPEQQLSWALESVPLNLVCYFPRQTMVLVPPPLPPPRFARFTCPVQFASLLSIFFLFPPLRPCLFSRPSPSSSVWPPVVLTAEVYNPPADCRPMPSHGVLSSVSYEGLPPPPRYVRLVVLGSGVGEERRIWRPPRWP